MELAFSVVACAWLLSVIGWMLSLVTHRAERRELMNRIMARDYHEFTLLQTKAPPNSRENWLEKQINDANRRKARAEVEADDE